MHRTSLLIATLACLAIATTCRAQEDPFGGPAAPPAAAAGAAAAKASKAKLPEEVVRPPLVIELLRSSKPATPPQLLQAAQIAFQYGNSDEAKVYLGKLAASAPADEALAPLAAPHADFLVQLAATESLQPEGRQVASLILAAADKTNQAAEPIAAAIKQFSSANPGEQQQAYRALAAAGSAAINPLLRVLADKSRASEHAPVRAAIVALASVSELPLLAVLQASDKDLQMQAVAMLGRMQSQRAAPFLIRHALSPASPADMRELAAAALQRILGKAPDIVEAETFLRREIDQWMRGELSRQRNINDQVQVWMWDERAQLVAPLALAPRDAGLLLAARAASDLFTLLPHDPAALRLMLLTNLELAKILSGPHQPLPMTPGTAGASALAAGPATTSQVLAQALAQERTAAAIAAAEVLGAAGDATVLHQTTGLSPLATALRSADRRVRLAAALAAVKLDPGGTFPGLGLIAPTLAAFIKTSGHPAVLVGNPHGEEAQSLVAYLGPLGYEGESVTSGRLVVERLRANPDFDFLLVSDAIDGPSVEELVQWLRRDFRTARLPIGVMARSERREALSEKVESEKVESEKVESDPLTTVGRSIAPSYHLRETFQSDPFTTVFAHIHSPEVAARSMAALQALAGRNFVGADERLAQAEQALAALNELAKSDENLARYDLFAQEPAMIVALHHPALSSDAAKLLARLGTPTAQAALLDFASQANRSMEERQAAAAAFASAVKGRGLRLTQAQVLRQFDRYNASATLDQPTQLLLGGILDTIEGHPVGAAP